MRACWLKWVGRDWSISADYIWLNYSDANTFIDCKMDQLAQIVFITVLYTIDNLLFDIARLSISNL